MLKTKQSPNILPTKFSRYTVHSCQHYSPNMYTAESPHDRGFNCTYTVFHLTLCVHHVYQEVHTSKGPCPRLLQYTQSAKSQVIYKPVHEYITMYTVWRGALLGLQVDLSRSNSSVSHTVPHSWCHMLETLYIPPARCGLYSNIICMYLIVLVTMHVLHTMMHVLYQSTPMACNIHKLTRTLPLMRKWHHV